MRMRTGIGNLDSHWDGNPHCRSRGTGFYFESTATLCHPSRHSQDSDSQASSGAIAPLDGILLHPSASIADFQVDPAGIASQLNLGRLGAGVPLNVRQAL